MREPTWNPAVPGLKTARAARAKRRNEDQNLWWLVDAAPCAVAAAWMGITLAAMIGGAATGQRDLLDGCRSDAVVAIVGTLAAAATLVASVWKGVRR